MTFAVACLSRIAIPLPFPNKPIFASKITFFLRSTIVVCSMDIKQFASPSFEGYLAVSSLGLLQINLP